MKKSKIKFLVALAIVAVVGIGIVRAATLALTTQVYRCTIAEQAAMGASHKITVTYADLLTATTTNEAMTCTIPILAKMGAEVVYADLKTAFAGTTFTNGTTSLTCIIGDGGDDDRFLASMQVAAANTEIWLKYGTGTKLAYTTTDTIDIKFQPNAENTLDELTAGEITFYLNLKDTR